MQTHPHALGGPDSQGWLEWAAEVRPHKGVEPLLHGCMPCRLVRPGRQLLLLLPTRRVAAPLLVCLRCRLLLRLCRCLARCRTPAGLLGHAVGQRMQVLQPAHARGAVAHFLRINDVLHAGKWQR